MMKHSAVRRLLIFCLALVGCGIVVRTGWARNDVSITKDVVYGTQEGVKLLLDVYQPSGFQGKRPGIIFVHGGGWSFGNKGMYEPFARSLASKGFVCFSINYRLLPQSHYPAQLDDAQRSVRYIRAHADSYNLDPDRLGALGDSAGGYLVAMLGTRETRDNSDADLSKYSSKVQCVVDFYGPADFTIPPVAPHVSEVGIQIVEAFLNQKRNTDPDIFKQSSPVTFVDKQSAPFLIIHGTDDTLVPQEQSQLLFAKLKAAGVDATLLLAYKQAHGFLNAAYPTWYGAAATDFFTRLLKP